VLIASSDIAVSLNGFSPYNILLGCRKQYLGEREKTVKRALSSGVDGRGIKSDISFRIARN
jgi:hypothetical protein